MKHLLLTWFALLEVTACLLLPNAARAASVRAVSPSKGQVAVDLEPGETPKKGDSVCFFTSSLKKIDCGKAVKLKGQILIVQMRNKATIGRLKKAMPAKISGGDGDGGDDAGPGAAAGDSEAAATSSSKEATGSRSKYTSTRLWLAYAPALTTPSTYSQISYKAPDGKTAPASLWQSGKASGLSLVGFAAQLGFPVGKKAMMVGLRYRKMTPSVVDTDYTIGQAEPYASTTVSSTALGLWAVYQFYRTSLTPALSFNLNGGLDIDQSTVTVAAAKKNDNAADSGNIVSATSKLTMVSPRFGPAFDFYVAKSFGFTFALDLTIPLLAAAKSFSASFPDGEDRGMTTPVAITDLKTVLAHKKGSVGVDVTLGAFFAF